jgi:fatty-acyl-CoA synthase
MHVPMTTVDFIDRAELVYGDRVGIVDEPEQPAASLGELTYGAFAARVRGLAAGLDELGAGAGDRVAVVTPNAARLLELFFAVTSYGRILVPINFRLQAAEIAYIVEHSGATTLLVDPEHAKSLGTVNVKNQLVLGKESDAALVHPDREPAPWANPDEDATATINYTSGTTARPKGVQITHRNIWVNAATFALHAGVTDRDVYLHTLPMFHANGWGMPFATTGLGVPQIVIRKIDGPEILRRIDRYGVTFLCAAPAVVNAILEAAQGWEGDIPGRDRVRIICAGAPTPSRTIERIQDELGWEYLQIYGLTETSPLLTVNRSRQEDDALPPEERARKLSRAGAPALGTRIGVDPDGEVLARSNVVLAGYWQQPAETAAALAGGWFHTGDGGSVDDQGYLHISDRKKDVIITGGENVSSIEVEDRLLRHPDVAEAAVIGVPSEKWGETVLAVVVLADGAEVGAADLIAHCKAGLAGFKAPTAVEFVDSIPRTATGKVQKFRLRERHWANSERQVN